MSQTTLYERYENLILWALTTFTAGASAVIGWLVRRIVTNQRQISELKSEIAIRSAQREIEMQTLLELKTEVRELRNDVKTLFSEKENRR